MPSPYVWLMVGATMTGQLPPQPHATFEDCIKHLTEVQQSIPSEEQVQQSKIVAVGCILGQPKNNTPEDDDNQDK